MSGYNKPSLHIYPSKKIIVMSCGLGCLMRLSNCTTEIEMLDEEGDRYDWIDSTVYNSIELRISLGLEITECLNYRWRRPPWPSSGPKLANCKSRSQANIIVTLMSRYGYYVGKETRSSYLLCCSDLMLDLKYEDGRYNVNIVKHKDVGHGISRLHQDRMSGVTEESAALCEFLKSGISYISYLWHEGRWEV